MDNIWIIFILYESNFEWIQYIKNIIKLFTKPKKLILFVFILLLKKNKNFARSLSLSTATVDIWVFIKV